MKSSDSDTPEPIQTEPKMALRDWFAGHALAALLARDGAADLALNEGYKTAHQSYKMADAMMARRSQP